MPYIYIYSRRQCNRVLTCPVSSPEVSISAKQILVEQYFGSSLEVTDDLEPIETVLTVCQWVWPTNERSVLALKRLADALRSSFRPIFDACYSETPIYYVYVRLWWIELKLYQILEQFLETIDSCFFFFAAADVIEAN